jgi:hypothetical protein
VYHCSLQQQQWLQRWHCGWQQEQKRLKYLYVTPLHGSWGTLCVAQTAMQLPMASSRVPGMLLANTLLERWLDVQVTDM